MPEISCLEAIKEVANFNGEIFIISSKTMAMAILASLPILSILNLHAKSLWSLALTLRNFGHGTSTTAVGEFVKEEDDSVELQCVICLCEVSNGEIYRLLTPCKHGFHVECLDAWLQTHSTCPICRCPVPCTSAKIKQPNNVYEAILSYVDHICKWFVNPLDFELTSTLNEDYHSFLS